MHIGWAQADLTPERPVRLQGQFYERISRRVNDPLLAVALAIEVERPGGGREAAVMVSCDRVSIPIAILQRVREKVASRLPDLDPRQVFLHATHTHTAPEITEEVRALSKPEVMTSAEYSDLLVDRVAECVERAWRGRAAGGVSWGFGHAVVGHNRRTTYFDGAARMYGPTDREEFAHIEGYEEPGVDMLFTWDERQALTGLVINLACPSQVTEGADYVSADFWHEVRLEIARRHGTGVFLLPQCSAAGDQSPHLLLHKRAEARMRERRGLTEREEIARRIAAAVEDAFPVAKADIHSEPVFRHTVLDLDLPARRITEAEYQHALRQYQEHESRPPDEADPRQVSRREAMLRRYRGVIDRYREPEARRTHPVEVHLLRLGDVAFATNPFELFLDFGLCIKARSQALQTFVIQLAGPGSYVPTARAVAAAGYGAEPADNRVGPEGGQALVEATLQGLHAMWDG